MSIEEALLARARPHVLAQRTKEVFLAEISKGCRLEISPQPVALEPTFQPITGPRNLPAGGVAMPWVPELPPPAERLLRLKVWISPKQKCDWNRSELFLKGLTHAGRRIGFEIVGNRQHVGIYILCHREDYAAIRTPFRGWFELCDLTPCPDHPLQGVSTANWDGLVFGEWFPPPPYSHLLTRPDELKLSPYSPLITALAEISAPAIGIYQVVFAPVSPAHNWHQNVEALLDMEYQLKLFSGAADPGRYLQQPPSGQLNLMTGNVEYKAHSDKPFYAVVLRMGLLDGGAHAELLLRGLAGVAGLIQHGGRPLGCLTEEQYGRSLSAARIRRMFLEGLTHRPGFLLNSWELASLVHIPPPQILEHLKTSVARLEPLPPDESLTTGTPIGICSCAGRDIPVCIPEDFRYTHLHLIAKPGKGKSTLIEHMFLHEIGLGHGAIVLDPHGRLIKRLLCLIPREQVDRVIYFNPGDPDWVPLWNPLQKIPGQDLGTTADNLVNAFKKIVKDWGDRLENLLRQVFYAALNLPGSTLLDVLNSESGRTRPGGHITARRNNMNASRALILACVAVGLPTCTAGAVNIETVFVGNMGNAADTRYHLDQRPEGFGRVDYAYRIGKYEVTAGQYTEFLNAVAKTDPYGLYSTDMWSNDKGCKIQRNGSSGNYSYTVAADFANHPVNYVSWGDAARFANWLHNHQPVGAQGPATTESGAYVLKGATNDAGLLAVTRTPNATWVIPSEDEWYKAAYHQNNGITGDYWDYPTCSHTAPGRDVKDANGNNANYHPGRDMVPINQARYTTLVGQFQNSAGPYGTFDQGGNVFEWNEAVLFRSYRGMRGGSFWDFANNLPAVYRSANYPAAEFWSIGFRVAHVFELATRPALAPSEGGSSMVKASVIKPASTATKPADLKVQGAHVREGERRSVRQRVRSVLARMSNTEIVLGVVLFAIVAFGFPGAMLGYTRGRPVAGFFLGCFLSIVGWWITTCLPMTTTAAARLHAKTDEMLRAAPAGASCRTNKRIESPGDFKAATETTTHSSC